MEFMRGGELFQLLRTQKRFTEELAKFYSVCVILALKSLHKKDILYRDLKLENILLDEKGYAKIADFGLTKIL